MSMTLEADEQVEQVAGDEGEVDAHQQELQEGQAQRVLGARRDSAKP
jgi:hypothetical protein